MKIRRMQASFGGLEHETLELGEGLNIIQAPNEAGKSTWSAFLRAMLYGINTKERDKQGFIAEKNRYQPWSGAPMEGTVELVWRGREITLRRGPRGSVPFGRFEAVFTGTGEAAPGLTGENCGEALTGAPRDVFERSAFVGQGRAAIDSSPALEARVSALASSGEEEVSFSQVERRLRDWRNRRQHNRTGYIPQLEGELEQINGVLERQAKVHRLAEEIRRETDRLEAEYARLEEERDVYLSRAQAERRRRYEQARAALEQAQVQADAIEAELCRYGPPPEKELLNQVQEELSGLNALTAGRRQAQHRVDESTQELEEARTAAADSVFDSLPEEQALEQARRDAQEARQVRRPAYWALGLLAVGLVMLALPLAAGPNGWAWPCRAGGAACALGAGLAFLWSLRRQKAARERRDALLERYEARTPDGILERANAYCGARMRVFQAQQRCAQAQDALEQIAAQEAEQRRLLLEHVRAFAPQAADVFSITAAVNRAAKLLESRAAAQVRLSSARQLVEGLPQPVEGPDSEKDGPPPRFDPKETAARLSAAEGELGRLHTALATAQGELNSLGDPDELHLRGERLQEELLRRRAEHEALGIALEGLEKARCAVQTRFSPALNRQAGEYLALLTGGKYDQVVLTRQFEALAQQAGEFTPRRGLALSQGTAEQLYLAVRLAVCRLALPEEEPAPLVLDDALANFDDERCALALKCLAQLARERQVILFTCHGREAELCRGWENVRCGSIEKRL